MCHSNCFMYLSALWESKLFQGHFFRKYNLKSFGYDFGDDLVDSIAQGDRSEVIQGVQVILIWNKGNKG
jgi:hypothetical protein